MKGEYTVNDLVNIKECLNHLLHYVLNKHVKEATKFRPNSEKNVYSIFWDKICSNNRNIEIYLLFL